MQILVLGYIVRGPLGGLCWHHLQYVLGLKELGHQILFLEDSDDYAGCYNPQTFETGTDPTYGLHFIQNLFSFFNLQNQWAYYDAHVNKWYGQSKMAVTAFCKNADAVLNLSSVNPLRDWWIKIPQRILVDTDPGFTQIKHLSDKQAMETAKAHTHFFSFGENIGKDDCLIPDDGMNWKSTRQPVFLNAWKNDKNGYNKKWTTVLQWDSYKVREYNNIVYGMKSMSFDDYKSLPGLLHDEEFELALGSESAPKKKLIQLGWKIVDPLQITLNASSYQNYINTSKGEWSIAKHGYVISNSGWFSERSACYLASSKPVVVQDTGFSKILETGKGIIAFKNLEEAIEGIEKINKDYISHRIAARQLAEENFNSNKILTMLLKEL